MRSILLFLVLVLSVIVAFADQPSFDDYLNKQKKKYFGVEYQKKSVDYANNVKKIDELNQHAKKNGHNVKYAVNKFSDMNIVDFRKNYMGLLNLPASAHIRQLAKAPATTKTTTTKTTTTKTTTTKTTTTKTTTTKTSTTKTSTTKSTKSTTTKSTSTMSTKTTTILPTVTSNSQNSFDWSQSGYMTPIKSQGGCGSCWAFATVALVETSYARKGNQLTSFSEQMLVDCEKTSYGCSGGYPYYAMMYEQANGTKTSLAYPYVGSNQACNLNAGSAIMAFSSFDYTRSEAVMFNYLPIYGPILICLDADDIMSYSGGIIMSSNCGSNSINHAVVLVGYGTENGIDYWKVRNSWDTWWGENGYFRMQRNANTCGMTNYYSYYITA